VLILVADISERRSSASGTKNISEFSVKSAALVGTVQGLCLPFRGFSRSGATNYINRHTCRCTKVRVEDFSFALAVMLTPAVDVREVLILFNARLTLAGAFPPQSCVVCSELPVLFWRAYLDSNGLVGARKWALVSARNLLSDGCRAVALLYFAAIDACSAATSA